MSKVLENSKFDAELVIANSDCGKEFIFESFQVSASYSSDYLYLLPYLFLSPDIKSNNDHPIPKGCPDNVPPAMVDFD